MRKLTVVVALALVITPFMVGTAQAVSTCVWDSGTATLTIAADEDATMQVAGQDITLEGFASCAPPGATTATVDQIIVNGTAGDDLFTVFLGGGPFAPGAEVEGSGTSEIEIAFDLGAGVGDQVFLVGTNDSDTFELGTAGTNLNADDDADVTFGGVEEVGVLGEAGPDVVAGDGSASVGGAFLLPLQIDGGSDNDSITGGDGSDFVEGGAGTDEVAGGGEADVLSGGPGPDELTGGQGFDTVTYEDAAFEVFVDLAAHTASGGGGADALFTIEDVLGTAFADLIIGDDGGNELFGLGGNDLINGRGGPDDFMGGLGRDRANFVGAPGNVTVTAGSASGWGNDLLDSIEDVLGSSHNDRITGSASANRLWGGGGNDTLRGGGGADFLGGSAGRDRVAPGLGEDRASGGRGRDTIDLSGASRSVTINLATGRTGGNGADRIGGFEIAVGSRFADSLVGNGGRNTLIGGRGDDRLGGQGRADRLDGGPGQDRVGGGDGPDLLIGGAAHDVLNGGGGDDRLNGGDGPDLLHGDAGNDALNGGPGTDTCFQDGGSGPKTSCEKPAPPPSGGGGGGGGNCSPSYPDFCIPPPPPDLDCDQVNGSNFRVVGSDPHGFDGDGDGVGCES